MAEEEGTNTEINEEGSKGALLPPTTSTSTQEHGEVKYGADVRERARHAPS